MSTEAPLVSPADTTVLYLARRSELRLTMKPRYAIRNPVSGQIDGYTPGAWIGFRDGQVRIPKTGTVQMQDTLDGGMSEAMEAEDVHAWLMGHRLNGNREEGFWRVDPAAPPISNEELETLMDAALRLDVDVLEEIIRQERAGWAREQIIGRAQGALDRIGEMQQAQAQADAQEPAAEPPKAKQGPKPKASDG